MTSVTHIVSEKIILKINENLPNMLTIIICLNSNNVSIAEMGNVLFSNDTKHHRRVNLRLNPQKIDEKVF